MIKHRKDTQQLTEAYDMIRNESQTIDEKGGMIDRALAKSPIAKMFGGVSQRAAGRVTSKNDSKKMMDRFWATLGRNNKPITVGQLKEFFARTVPQLGNLKDSIPVLQGMGDDEMLKPRQVKKMMPNMVDQIHEIIASGSSSAGAEEVDPNSMFGAAPVATPQAPAQSAQTPAPQAPVQSTQTPAPAPEAPAPEPEAPAPEPEAPVNIDPPEAIKPAISGRGQDGRAYGPTGTLLPVDPATGEPQQSLPNPVDSQPEPEAPAPEPEAPAPEPEAPAPEPEAPAPEPEALAPEPEAPAPEPEAPAPEAPTGKSTDKKNVVRRIQRNLNKGKPVSKADIQMMRDAGVKTRDTIRFTDPKTGEKKTVQLRALMARTTNRESVQHTHNTIGRCGFMSSNWGNF